MKYFTQELMKITQIKFDKIIMILMCVLIYTSCIFIGSPIQSNASIFEAIALLIILIYATIQKFILKNFKIIKGKVDIICLILAVSTITPLIAGTYKNLNSQINGTFTYVTLFGIYIVVRDLIERNKEYKKNIISSIIYSSIFIAFTGIDMLTTNMITKALFFFGNPETVNMENRMMGIMGYENAFAVLMAVNVMLCLGKYNQDGKKSLFSITYIFISSLILSYSRLTFIIFGLILIAYIILLKDKNSRIDTCVIFATNMIIGIAFSIIFQKILNVSPKSYIVWLIQIVMCALSFIIGIIYEKVKEKIYKINVKTYAISGGVFVLIAVIIVGVGLNLSRPLKLYQTVMEKSDVKYKILNIKGDTDYTIDIDIFSKALKSKNYSIEIVEENIFYDTVVSHEIEFGNFDGTKTFTFHTDSKTTELALIFRTSNRIYNRGLEIKDVRINNKKYIINYAYLPERLVTKVKGINFQSKSTWERFVFIRDAFRVIKDNWLFGIGADGWMDSYKSIQDYNYNTMEVHSYLVQLLLEYGILAFVSLICLVVITIKNSVKEKDSSKLCIICALAILFLHSLLDFELSFMNMMFIMTVLFTMINSNQMEKSKLYIKKYKKSREIVENFTEIIIFIAIISILYFNVIDSIGKIYLDKTDAKTSTIKKFSKMVPYNRNYVKRLAYESDDYMQKLFKMDRNTNVESTSQMILEKAENSKRIKVFEARYIYDNLTSQVYTSDCYLIVKQNEKLSKMCEIIGNEENEELQQIKKLTQEYMKNNYSKNIVKIENADINRLSSAEIEALTARLNQAVKNDINERIKNE